MLVSSPQFAKCTTCFELDPTSCSLLRFSEWKRSNAVIRIFLVVMVMILGDASKEQYLKVQVHDFHEDPEFSVTLR